MYDRGEVLELQTSLRAASGYKGVYPSSTRWIATLAGTSLGSFDDARDAAIAYARELRTREGQPVIPAPPGAVRSVQPGRVG